MGDSRRPLLVTLAGMDSKTHGTQCEAKRRGKKGGNRKIMRVNMLPRDSNTYLSLTVASVTRPPPSTPFKEKCSHSEL